MPCGSEGGGRGRSNTSTAWRGCSSVAVAQTGPRGRNPYYRIISIFFKQKYWYSRRGENITTIVVRSNLLNFAYLTNQELVIRLSLRILQHHPHRIPSQSAVQTHLSDRSSSYNFQFFLHQLSLGQNSHES